MKRLTALIIAAVLLAAGGPAASARSALSERATQSESTANGQAVVLPDDVPSPWAYDEVTQAIVLGMVPVRLQTHWRSPITRIQFAEMVIHFMAFQYGFADDASFVSQYCARSADRDGVFLGPGSWWNRFCGEYGQFSDLHHPEDRGYGRAAYALNIINGRDEDTFDPGGLLTRQEAAAILLRCYQCYGGPYALSGEPRVVEDQADVADWAAEGVAAVLDLKVMNGTAAGHFEPEGTYTREQAVLSLLRLYANAPVSRGKGNIPAL